MVTAVYELLRSAVMNCAIMSAIHSYIERFKIRTYSTSCLVF